MMHVRVLGTKLNLNSAIFGCALNRCCKGTGRCEGLIEKRPCGLNAMGRYMVCCFLLIFRLYLLLLEQFFRLLSEVVMHVCAYACSQVDPGPDKLLISMVNLANYWVGQKVRLVFFFFFSYDGCSSA